MNPQVNWQKIRDEFQRLTDVEQIKSEVHRIGAELRKFDLQSVLSPSAQEKMKAFEARYGELMKTLSKAQVKVDREFHKVMKVIEQLKDHRADVTKVVNEQKQKLEKISTEIKHRFTRGGDVTDARPTKRAGAARRPAKDVKDAKDSSATKTTPKRKSKSAPKGRGA